MRFPSRSSRQSTLPHHPGQRGEEPAGPFPAESLGKGAVRLARLQNTVDEKYRAHALKQGIELKIAYQPGFPEAQKIVAHDGSFTIQLNSDVIDEADYETYLSYNVRKIVLPRLRLETDRLVLRPFGRDDAEDAPAYAPRTACSTRSSMSARFPRLRRGW